MFYPFFIIDFLSIEVRKDIYDIFNGYGIEYEYCFIDTFYICPYKFMTASFMIFFVYLAIKDMYKHKGKKDWNYYIVTLLCLYVYTLQIFIYGFRSNYNIVYLFILVK